MADHFVWIEGGTFRMGSPETENWRIEDETPHEVTVSGFWMSPYETTQAEYERLMGNNPSSFKGENLPVESVSWLDAVRFCNAMSQEAGLTPAYEIDGETVTWNRGADGYRLPTEAEWEYAARGGRKSKGFVVTRKPIVPTEEERERNSRSKSAKLRVFERRTEK